MRKFFTLMAAAAITLTAAAADQFTATPASGTTVTELTTITLEPTGGAGDVDNISVNSIEVTKDGDYFCGVTAKGTSTKTLTLKTTANTPGTYVVNIPDGAFEIWTPDYSESKLSTAFSLTYTIEGSGEPDPVFEMSPANGSVVESIASFQILYNSSEYYGVESMDADLLTITRDGQAVTGYHWSNSDPGTGKSTFKLSDSKWESTTITEPGTYVITIPAGNLIIYTPETDENGDYKTKTNNQPIEITYTIPAPAYTFNPEPGDVKKLDTIVMTGDAARYTALAAVEGKTVTVTKDGTEFGTASAAAEGTAITYTLNPAPTEAGAYKVVIPAESVQFTPIEGEATTNDEAIELEYNFIVADPTVYDLTVTKTIPAAGEVDLEERQFETINIYMSDAAARPKDGATATLKCEKVGYEVTGKIHWSHTNMITMTLGQTVTKNGVYTLTIPQGTFGDEAWIADNETGHANAEQVLTYTVIGGTGDAAAYDLEIIKTKPAADSEVDLEMVQFENVILTVDKGVLPIENAKATLACAGARYSEDCTMTSSVDGQIMVMFPMVTVDGTYTLTIPQGMFGDADFVADPTTGHANAAFTCSFEVTGGIPQTSATLDLMPLSITPEEEDTHDLSEIIVTMPEGTMLKSNAIANLSCTEANYYENIIIRGGENGIFTIVPQKAPTKNGVYVLTIKEGVFGDADFMADNNTGHANTIINKTWNFSEIVSVDSILTDGEEVDVYNFQGIRVASKLEGLPAGMYIVKGRKVVIK